jgi:putative Mg2+ transporter-C (MgtC) family protein
VAGVRDLLDEVLSRANYPIREIEALSESEDQVELAAKLVPTTADAEELDHVVTELDESPLVLSATWTMGVAS